MPWSDIQDWQPFMWGANKTVEFHSVTKGQPDIVVRMTDACIYSVMVKSPKPSGGALKDNDARFVFSWDSLAGIRPKLKDRVRVDESVRHFGGRFYTILDGSPAVQAEHYPCVGRDLVIEHALADRVAVWRAIAGVDGAGRVIRTYAPKYLNLIGKAQPQAGTMGEELGVKGVQIPWTVFLEYDPGIETNDQIRLEDGTILEVEGTQDPAAIDALPAVLCSDQGARW